ncbi:MAG: response regulator [Firmicutes bacterium]|nr:response regulator [Bacillota bacterium]
MKKILVVDDESPLRMLIRATLEDDEFEIFEAEDGIAGLEQACANLPDLIILDMMMPGLTGLEVCRKLKQDPRTAHIKILLLTAKGQQRDKEAALAAGADYFIAKPFSPSGLITFINKVFG